MSQKINNNSSSETENNFSQIVISPGWDQLGDFQFVSEAASSVDGQQILKAVDLLRSKSVDGYHSRAKITEETASKYFSAGKSFNSKINFIADNLEYLAESLKSGELNESEIRSHLTDSRELITSALGELEVLKDVLETTKKKSNTTFTKISNETESVLDLLSDIEKNFEEKINQKQMTSNMFETGQLVQYGSNSLLTGFGTFNPYADLIVSAPAKAPQEKPAPQEAKAQAEKKTEKKESEKAEAETRDTDAEKAEGLNAAEVADTVKTEMSPPADKETAENANPAAEEVKPEEQKKEEASGMNASEVAGVVENEMTPEDQTGPAADEDEQAQEESNKKISDKEDAGMTGAQVAEVVKNEMAPDQDKAQAEKENTEEETDAKKLFDSVPELEPEKSLEASSPDQLRESIIGQMKAEKEAAKDSEAQSEEGGSALDEESSPSAESPETSGIKLSKETLLDCSSALTDTKVGLIGRDPAAGFLKIEDAPVKDNKVYSFREIVKKIGRETILSLKKAEKEVNEIAEKLRKVQRDIKRQAEKGAISKLLTWNKGLKDKLRKEEYRKLEAEYKLKIAERKVIEDSIKEQHHDTRFQTHKDLRILSLVAVPTEKYNVLPTYDQMRMVMNVPDGEQKLVVTRQGEKLYGGGHKPDDVLELRPYRNGKYKLYLNGEKVSEVNTAYADDALKIAMWFQKSDPGAPIIFTRKKYTEYTIVPKDFYSYN